VKILLKEDKGCGMVSFDYDKWIWDDGMLEILTFIISQ